MAVREATTRSLRLPRPAITPRERLHGRQQRAGHGRTADWESFNEPDARKSYNGTLKGAGVKKFAIQIEKQQ